MILSSTVFCMDTPAPTEELPRSPYAAVLPAVEKRVTTLRNSSQVQTFKERLQPLTQGVNTLVADSRFQSISRVLVRNHHILGPLLTFGSGNMSLTGLISSALYFGLWNQFLRLADGKQRPLVLTDTALNEMHPINKKILTSFEKPASGNVLLAGLSLGAWFSPLSALWYGGLSYQLFKTQFPTPADVAAAREKHLVTVQPDGQIDKGIIASQGVLSAIKFIHNPDYAPVVGPFEEPAPIVPQPLTAPIIQRDRSNYSVLLGLGAVSAAAWLGFWAYNKFWNKKDKHKQEEEQQATPDWLS